MELQFLIILNKISHNRNIALQLCLVVRSDVQSRLPNLIIAGVVKGGTTSLFTYLSWHPEICASTIKETKFFMPLRFGEPLSSLDAYSEYFNPTTLHKYIMEASPGYLFGGLRLARKIREVLGPITIIFILRDPVRRLFSLYRHLKKGLRIPASMSFEEYVRRSEEALLSLQETKAEKRGNVYGRGISGGFYADYLDEWYVVFGSSIRVFFFEDLKTEPLLLMRRVCDALEIRSDIYSEKSFTVENKSIMYRSRAIHKLARSINLKFERFFRSHYGLKKSLRKVYFLVNEAACANDFMTSAVQLHLETIYSKYNHRLFHMLSSKGYRSFPEWLNASSSIPLFSEQLRVDFHNDKQKNYLS